jgi:hypothetical protein
MTAVALAKTVFNHSGFSEDGIQSAEALAKQTIRQVSFRSAKLDYFCNLKSLL